MSNNLQVTYWNLIKFHLKTLESLKVGFLNCVHEQTLNCDVKIAAPTIALLPENVIST